MGKRQVLQRRGKGGSVFKSPSWRRIGSVRYPAVTAEENSGSIEFTVKEILHEAGRTAPLMLARSQAGAKTLTIAPEGVFVGQKVYFGTKAPVNVGNVLPLKSIPEGTMVCNIEGRSNDGGRYVRSAGGYATVVSHTPDGVLCQFPSGAIKTFPADCRATIGIVASGGVVEKPVLKAGSNYHKYRARSVKYPRVRGKAMSPYAHPHGGGSHPKGGRPVGRNAPPGQKVGIIASRRTGRTKK